MKSIKKTKEGENYDQAFPITSVCRADLESIGFDAEDVDDGTMLTLASKMADAYCDMGFWESLEVLAGHYGIKKIEGRKPEESGFPLSRE